MNKILKLTSVKLKLLLLILLSVFIVSCLEAYNLWKLKEVAQRSKEIKVASENIVNEIKKKFYINKALEDIHTYLTFYIQTGDEKYRKLLIKKCQEISPALSEEQQKALDNFLKSIKTLKVRMSAVKDNRSLLFETQRDFFKGINELLSNCQTKTCFYVVSESINYYGQIEELLRKILLHIENVDPENISNLVDNVATSIEKNQKFLNNKEKMFAKKIIDVFYDIDDTASSIIAIQNKALKSQQNVLSLLKNLVLDSGESNLFQVTTSLVKKAEKTVKDTAKFSAVFMMLSLLFLFLFGTILARNISSSINYLVDKVNKMSHGDFSEKIESEGKDEISKLSLHIENFRSDFANLVKRVKNSIEEMEQLAVELETFSQNMAHDAQNTVDITNKTEEEMKKLRDFMEDTSKIVQNLVQEAKEIYEDTIKAKDIADNLVKNMINSEQIISCLNEQVTNIEEIIDFIHKIADETNLLALNATIEAARAGEAGRGFAVVAGEIKELANQTAQSTDKITQITREITEQVKKSVASIQENVKFTKDMFDMSERISVLVEKQTINYEEINDKIYQGSQNSSKVLKFLQNLQKRSLKNLEEEKNLLDKAFFLKKKAKQLEELVRNIKV